MKQARFVMCGLFIFFFALISASAAPRLTIVLTNDDGYDQPGIHILRDALVAAGHNAVIVAPLTNQSGRGTGVFGDLGGKLNLQFHAAENAWSVDGTPSDTVRVALEILKLRPDLVISGINFGENLGIVANHSGTVSASVWALESGYPAMAVSAGMNFAEADLTPPFPSTITAMKTAAPWVVELLNALDAGRHPGEPLLPKGIGLNINYPAVPHPGPVVLTTLSRGYNTLSYELKPAADFAITGNIVNEIHTWPAPLNPDKENDAEMFACGYITVTPIDGDWTGSAALLPPVFDRLVNLAATQRDARGRELRR